MTLSIIIPVLNEADNLPQLIAHIHSLSPAPRQVILVDGGSIDDSLSVAKSLLTDLSEHHPSAIDWHIIESTAGRARQMNAGAMMAQGDILLFLHADTQLPIDAIEAVQQGIARYDWGRFDVRLDSDELMLKLVSKMINWRSKLTSIATGDQAIFIKKSVFEQLGGYPDQPLMEDVELCKSLKGIAKPACLNSKVITSARRWQQNGTWRTIFLMWHLRFDYWRGVSPDVLKRRYYK